MESAICCSFPALIPRLGPSSSSHFLPPIRPSFPAKNHPVFSFRSRNLAITPVKSTRSTWKLPAAMAGTESSTEKGKRNVLVFDSEEDLSVSLAKYTADLSEKFLKERSAFTVVLSGGSLIKSLRY